MYIHTFYTSLSLYIYIYIERERDREREREIPNRGLPQGKPRFMIVVPDVSNKKLKLTNNFR